MPPRSASSGSFSTSLSSKDFASGVPGKQHDRCREAQKLRDDVSASGSSSAGKADPNADVAMAVRRARVEMASLPWSIFAFSGDTGDAPEWKRLQEFLTA